jgi:hypothetical protein
MPFKGDFVTKNINDTWSMLTQDLVFCSKWLSRSFTAKAGFVTDFASVPRLPIIFMLLGGRGKRPATIHDKNYADQVIPKRQCDLVFFEGLLDTYVLDAWKAFVCEEIWWKEWRAFGIVLWRFFLSLLMYLGVVIFGWGTWLKYKYRRKKGLPLRPEAPDVEDGRWEDRVF